MLKIEYLTIHNLIIGLNDREIEETIGMTSALHSSRRGQIESVAGATPAGGRGANFAPSQSESIMAESIQMEMNKLRVLYGPSGQRIKGAVPWGELEGLLKIIEDLTRQYDAPIANDRRMEEQLARLEKIAGKLEKEPTPDKNWVDSWAKMVSEGLSSSARSPPNGGVCAMPPVRGIREEFEVRVYIKGEEKVKRVMATTTDDMVNRARETDAATTLPARKNIIAVRRRPGLVTFRVRTEESKRILEENDFWTKEVSPNASLRGASYGVVVHGVRVEGMPKDMEKDGAKALTKANNCIHPGVTIDTVEWLTKDSQTKRYASLVARVASAEMTNRLIDEGVCHESDIKTMQFYDTGCRIQQCLKCQAYGHKTYGCKSIQKCVYCAQNHRSEHCPHKQARDMWKCGACKDTHRAFDPQCKKRQTEKKRTKRARGSRPIYHAVRSDKTSRATASTTQTGTSASLESLIGSSLKRKVGRPTNASRSLSAAAAQGNTIIDHLAKRPRPSESAALPHVSTSTSMESSMDDAGASQIIYGTQAEFEEEL